MSSPSRCETCGTQFTLMRMQIDEAYEEVAVMQRALTHQRELRQQAEVKAAYFEQEYNRLKGEGSEP